MGVHYERADCFVKVFNQSNTQLPSLTGLVLTTNNPVRDQIHTKNTKNGSHTDRPSVKRSFKFQICIGDAHDTDQNHPWMCVNTRIFQRHEWLQYNKAESRSSTSSVSNAAKSCTLSPITRSAERTVSQLLELLVGQPLAHNLRHKRRDSLKKCIPKKHRTSRKYLSVTIFGFRQERPSRAI
jgi:hypothetical protein